MAIDWPTIEKDIGAVASVVAKLAPYASVAGPVGATAGGIISAAAGFAAAALTALENEQAVVSASDLASIHASAAKIQAANDTLAGKIAGS